jgi:AcrR family transcriptional regulator
MESGTAALRERKKERTRVDLATAARRLTAEHGLDAVTVAQIADAADVSVRTFFNYFRCKEEAVVGVSPSSLREFAETVLERPSTEPALTALIETLLQTASDPEMAEGWELRSELVRLYPSLLPRHLAAMADVEDALVAAVAERLGTDLSTDPIPTVLVATVVAVMRSTFSWWMHSDRAVPLSDVLARAFEALAGGFAVLQDEGGQR